MASSKPLSSGSRMACGHRRSKTSGSRLACGQRCCSKTSGSRMACGRRRSKTSGSMMACGQRRSKTSGSRGDPLGATCAAAGPRVPHAVSWCSSLASDSSSARLRRVHGVMLRGKLPDRRRLRQHAGLVKPLDRHLQLSKFRTQLLE